MVALFVGLTADGNLQKHGWAPQSIFEAGAAVLALLLGVILALMGG